MTDRVIIDTGPLVAFLHQDDQHHRWAVDRFKELAPPFLTCESVLSEACFLLGCETQAITKLAWLLNQDLITLPFRLSEEQTAVFELMRNYKNVPMSLADACLVRMAELESNPIIFTLDRDFQIYRKNRRQIIPAIMPEF